MGEDLGAIRAVLAANEAFYAAFREGSMEEMSSVWAEGLPVAVLHPGWKALEGRDAVLESWRRILEGAGGLPIQCRGPRAYVLGEVAYVLCTEEVGEGALGATNLFAMEEGRWRMVHHQAGPGGGPEVDEDGPESGLLN